MKSCSSYEAVKKEKEGMNMRFLPTLKQCLDICDNNISFKYKVEEIEGLKVYQFNYFLAKYQDFKNPISDKPEINAFELRGLTFVEQKDGSFKRFLMLDKFFNIGQTEDTLFDVVKDETIISVADKRDGSLITFVEIGGKVYAKSKFSFQSEQALTAQKIYNTSPGIKRYVDECLKYEVQPFFELTSPMNQIVLHYPVTELKVIQVRDLRNGEYQEMSETYRYYVESKFNVYFAEQLDVETYTFDYMMKERETREGIEGWVVTTNKWMYKIKCEEYMRLHHLMTDSVTREDEVIRMTLDEEIDDVLAEIPLDAKELRYFVETISDGIVNHVNELSKYVFEYVELLADEVKNTENPQKEFALIAKSNDLFSLMMRAYKDNTEENVEKLVIDYVKSKTNKLGLAKDYLEKLGIKVHFDVKEEDG